MKALLTGLGLFLVFGLIIVVVSPLFLRPTDVNSRRVNCLSNEKQLGLAFVQYTQDYDEVMPPLSDAPGSTNTWRLAIYPYVKSKMMYQCPDRATRAVNADGFAVSYAANDCGAGQGAFALAGAKPPSMRDFRAPSSLILLCEAENETRPDFDIEDTVTFGPGKNVLWAGHSGGSDYLFADGHVKLLQPMRTVPLWYRDPKKTLSAAGKSTLRDAETRFPAPPAGKVHPIIVP